MIDYEFAVATIAFFAGVIACLEIRAINKRIDKIVDMMDTSIANMAMSIAELERKVEKIENGMETLPEDKFEKLETELLKRASNKIEIGINSILNYDPYNSMGQNEEAE